MAGLMDWLSRFWGECHPTSVSALQGPSVLVAVDSLSLFISQLVRSSPQTGAHRHVRSQSHQNPLQNTHRLVQALLRFMPHQLLIDLNSLYNEEMDILQNGSWIPRNIITYHVGCSLKAGY